MSDTCLNCPNKLTHTPGRKKKKFCSTKCNQQYWQKHKPDAGKTKRIPLSKWKEIEQQLANKSSTPTEPIELPPERLIITDKAKASIQKEIDEIRAQTIPPERNTTLGRKVWAQDQQKKIKALQSRL